jgi:uncharacterized protein YbaR (Trm112 family)
MRSDSAGSLGVRGELHEDEEMMDEKILRLLATPVTKTTIVFLQGLPCRQTRELLLHADSLGVTARIPYVQARLRTIAQDYNLNLVGVDLRFVTQFLLAALDLSLVTNNQ